MLCVIGDLVEDIVVWFPHGFNYGENHGTDTPSRIVRTRGGSASNVAVFAASVTLHARFGSRFVGQVGSDALGDQLIAELRKVGVDPCVERAGRTGSIVVLVSPDGERTMLTDRAAATELVCAPANWFRDVSLLHVPAYSLFTEPLASATLSCIRDARDNNIRVTIDASSKSLLELFGIAAFRNLVTKLQPEVFFCNSDEADVLRLAEAPLNVSLVVIKAGAGPTMLITGNQTTKVDVAPVDGIIDTTGAGDAFAAGFLCEYLNNLPAQDCAVAGHRLATRVLRSPGATIGAT